jgi:hypothetical protein
VLWWLIVMRGEAAGPLYWQVWGAATVIYFIVLIPMLRAVRRQPARITQMATGVAWSGVGWAISIIVASLAVLAGRTNDQRIMFTLPSILTALYGATWWIGATLLRKTWMRVVACAAFALALVNAWFAATGDAVWLPYGLTLLALLAAPGVILTRQARRGT